MKKIISYNVNGLRAAINKGFISWLESSKPDVVCLQEIKANPEQIDCSVIENLGYHHYWFPAEKKGYSGVAIFSKQKPLHVEYGMGTKIYDAEGRMLRVDFSEFSVMSLYVPSGTSGDERQSFKMIYLEHLQNYIDKLRKKLKTLVITGDINICHRAIDIHNPVSNARSSGFLPEERDWIGRFMDSGFIDSFRLLNSEPHNYTWWSLRPMHVQEISAGGLITSW